MREVNRYKAERAEWNEAYQSLLKFSSEGPFAKEVLKAKEDFFGRLGRAHEVSEDLYELSSHTFLEWYLFTYISTAFHKTPAVVYVTLGLDTEDHLAWIHRSLFHHWSLFEVVGETADILILRDLLFGHDRRLFRDPLMPEFMAWKVKVGQIIQTRLFEFSDGKTHFMTHLWLHPQREAELLRTVCEKRRPMWSRHEEMLSLCIETVARTFGIESQLSVSQASNWNYQELKKKYA